MGVACDNQFSDGAWCMFHIGISFSCDRVKFPTENTFISQTNTLEDKKKERK